MESKNYFITVDGDVNEIRNGVINILQQEGFFIYDWKAEKKETDVTVCCLGLMEAVKKSNVVIENFIYSPYNTSSLKFRPRYCFLLTDDKNLRPKNNSLNIIVLNTKNNNCSALAGKIIHFCKNS